jgi:hypothetical protein
VHTIKVKVFCKLVEGIWGMLEALWKLDFVQDSKTIKLSSFDTLINSGFSMCLVVFPFIWEFEMETINHHSCISFESHIESEI